METIQITVNNMTCDACVKSVGQLLRSVEGVEEYSIDREANSVELDVEMGSTVRENVVAAINKTEKFSAQ